MIYHITRESDGKEWIEENPAFVRLNNENIYCLTNEANAHAVYIEGICYHIKGRAPIQGLADVMVGITEEEAYSNVEVKAKIDSHTADIADANDAIDELIIAITPMEAN